MAVKSKEEMYKHFGKAKICLGICLFVFGLIKYLGYSWEIAFMGIGILSVIAGLLCLLCKRCK